MKLTLKNTTDFVRSATITKSENLFFLNAQTKYGSKHEASRSLQSLKVMFGIHLLKGAKWEQELNHAPTPLPDPH